MHCKSFWIKASAKCINVNVNVNCYMKNVESNYIQHEIIMKNIYTIQIFTQYSGGHGGSGSSGGHGGSGSSGGHGGAGSSGGHGGAASETAAPAPTSVSSVGALLPPPKISLGEIRAPSGTRGRTGGADSWGRSAGAGT